MINYYILITILLSFICFFNRLGKANSNYMDYSNTNSVKGYCIIIIMLLHFSQIIDNRNFITELLIYSGGFTVGFFFFLTGFGYYIKHCEEYGFHELFSKIINIFKKLLLPLIICMIIEDQLTLGLFFKNFFTLTMPPYLIWYLKVYFFVTVFLFFITRMRVKYKILLVLLSSILYLVIMYSLKFPSFWYNSILCLPLGMIVAKYKEKIGCIKYMIVPAIILFLYSWYNIRNGFWFDIFCPIIFCVLCISFFMNFSFDSYILGKISKYTLGLYLWHLVFLRLILKIRYLTIEQKYFVWIISAFVLTIVLQELYDFARKYINKKFN